MAKWLAFSKWLIKIHVYMYKFLVIWKITVGRFSSFFSLFCLYFSFCSHHLHEEHRCQGASVRVKNKKNVTVLIFHRHQRQRHRFCLLFFGSEASNYQMILLSFLLNIFHVESSYWIYFSSFYWRSTFSPQIIFKSEGMCFYLWVPKSYFWLGTKSW